MSTIYLLSVVPSFALADKVELNLTRNEVAYTFFDLTHGEATLIQGINDQSVLINTGHSDSEDELKERLDMYNVSSIDTLVLTSKQIEYIGNLPWLLTNYSVDTIFIPKSLESNFASILSNFDIEISLFEKGDKYSLLNGLNIEVLYVEERKGTDEGGCAFFIQHHDQKLLYMTIANPYVEEELVKEYDLKSTMFKVPDFGSDRGTSDSLLEEVDPQIAVIFRNGEDQPSSFVLERLQETWIDIYQTSRIGTVTIKCNDEDYEVITVRPSKENILPNSWLTRNKRT
ncbi:beta-lactamase superfamily II metal-dependent hydrolase [Evansella vedderi]|uniref:Beta-lactamase superfamily II metal-dependent hydrolase n=1 Tax=Evansella vedderi TaxID=38282 RepID=A0ABU0A513_9BACI|nr:hypothetical protein [Evansella vedderi]MDQ0257440.1 beta-lactamase superfamily II metal-dependent hydrolase [Evansella vedderi]